MRLGDLDALKKEVESLVVGGAKGLKDYYENGSKSDENSWIGGVYDAWELINNAPSVELERPQGEWITKPIYCCNYYSDGCAKNKKYANTEWCSTCEFWKAGTFEYTCPHCVQKLGVKTNYCPNCGLPMKKGGAE